MLLQPLLQWQAVWAAECINSALTRSIKNIVFDWFGFLYVRTSRLDMLCISSTLAKIIGVKTKAHVLGFNRNIIIKASAQAEALCFRSQ